MASSSESRLKTRQCQHIVILKMKEKKSHAFEIKKGLTTICQDFLLSHTVWRVNE